jgi:prepilin-type N-terminal cleavage/methylation domain-containing protein
MTMSSFRTPLATLLGSASPMQPAPTPRCGAAAAAAPAAHEARVGSTAALERCGFGPESKSARRSQRGDTRSNKAVRGRGRGFNLIELLIALAITSALLTATLVALNASFMAYQSTTESASTHTIARLLMHRIQALIRTGTQFTPVPADPTESIITSSSLEITSSIGNTIELTFMPSPETDDDLYVLMVEVNGDGEQIRLLEGLVPQFDADAELIPPFTLEYQLGHKLYRATIDLTLQPDDNMDVTLDGQYNSQLRLVASAMPRGMTF